MALKTKEDIIRRILCNAGVNDIVKVFKAGKEMTGEKWRFAVLIQAEEVLLQICI
jgi:hypothetical protein